MATTTLDDTSIPLIRGRFQGDLLQEGDPGYDESRSLHNAMIDRKPRLIVRCAGAADVVAGILLAQETELPLSIKGGGHGVNGHAVCDGGVMLDLGPMNRVTVDPVARTARAQGGVRWGEFDAATTAHGLATTGGRVTTTGIAGLTLGVGSGWLERKHGYTSDNLLAADLITAEGKVVRASEDENPELFWGLRGGGGNFGVVTDFEYRLHEMPQVVLGGMMIWPIEQGAEVLRFYRDLMADAPDELGGGGAILTAPPAPFVPEELHGRRVVAVIAVAFTSPDRGEELLRPLREFGPPAADVIQPMPYTAVQQLIDPPNQPGQLNYWKAELVTDVTDELIDLELAQADQMRAPHSTLFVQPLRGQVARIPEDACAIGARSAPWVLHAIGVWSTPEETEHEQEWVRAWGRMVEPFRVAGVPMTFSADTGEERVRSTFGEAKYARLVALKNEYDPGNLFRLNQNIKPSGAT